MSMSHPPREAMQHTHFIIKRYGKETDPPMYVPHERR